MNEEGIDELRGKLISGVETLVVMQADRLRRAVEERGYWTAEQDGSAELLVASGLLRRSGGASGLHKDEYCYVATQEGVKTYHLIFNEKERG